MRLRTSTLSVSLALGLALSTGFSAQCRADASDGFSPISMLFFGSQAEQDKAATCEIGDNDQDAGIMGSINNLFCHMEKDLGIDKVSSGTKDFGQIAIHWEVTGSDGGGSVTVGSTSYDYQAYIWGCLISGSSCESASNFHRLMALAWSYSASDKTINKGSLLMDQGVFVGSGAGQDAFWVVWDLGKSSANRFITAKLVAGSGGQSFAMRADAAVTSTDLKSTIILAASGDEFRFAFDENRSTGISAAYVESSVGGFSGPGVGTFSGTATGDTPSSPVCLQRTSSGNDFDYTAISGSCSVPAFPNESANTVAAYSVSGLASSDSSYQGMPSSPSSI